MVQDLHHEDATSMSNLKTILNLGAKMWDMWKKKIGFLDTQIWNIDRCKSFVAETIDFIFDIP
jgi:hypothetical protein